MNKKHVVGLGLAAVIAVVAAAWLYTSSQSATPSEDDLERCGLVSLWAHGTMGMRQEGFSMSELMDLSKHEEDPNLRAIRQRSIQLAYEQKRYETPEAKERAVSDFENAAYLACLKGVKR